MLKNFSQMCREQRGSRRASESRAKAPEAIVSGAAVTVQGSRAKAARRIKITGQIKKEKSGEKPLLSYLASKP